MKGREFFTLLKYEQALIQLARYIDRIPGNEYKVEDHILEILELERIPATNKDTQ